MRSNILVYVALGVLPACVIGGVPSGTRITPAHFQFQTVVTPDTTPEGSGWRAVCIEARMSQGVANGPPVSSGYMCKFEVGVPFRNHLGEVDLSTAQSVAAEMANRVAYEILTTTSGVTALTCLRFQKEYRRRLAWRLPGATVGPCRSGVRVVPFP